MATGRHRVREGVWDGVPHDTRWHFHTIVELCCASRRYDGRLRCADALRCSDVPDAVHSVKELVTAGLLLDLGAMMEVENIDDFLPSEGQRPAKRSPHGAAMVTVAPGVTGFAW